MYKCAQVALGLMAVSLFTSCSQKAPEQPDPKSQSNSPKLEQTTSAPKSSEAAQPNGQGGAEPAKPPRETAWRLKERTTLEGHTKYINSLAFSPDGKTLASASVDKSIKLWDIGSGKNTKTF